jgi:Flp pilus assembly protein TadG
MNQRVTKWRDQRGVTIVIVAGLTVMFVAFVALSVDIAHLMVVRNELKNAADAGALAGARRLYFEDGSAVNFAANQVAFRAATDNDSERIAVEVIDPDSNSGDVQRGHWSFATQTFTPSNNDTPPDLWDVSSAELDADVTFVNAVRVRTRRQSTPAASFFARIMGFTGFEASAVAVAYLGFPGTLSQGEVDQPIAICRQSILLDEEYQCNIGRMLNSGSASATHNTAGWTNFSQPCETANANEMRSLVCSGGNPVEIKFGVGIGATGGVQDNVLRDLRDCFEPTTRTEPWNMTLPVVDCPGNNVSNCATVLGAVNVDVVWISRNDADMEEEFEDEYFPPAAMGDWTCDPICESSSTPRACCWDDFVDHFSLKNVEDMTATYAKKSIYFHPTCTVNEPTGDSGGANYGILAQIPVLVK